MSVFDNIRNDRGVPLTFVDRPGDSERQRNNNGPASIVERFFSRLSSGDAELDARGGMSPGFRGVPGSDDPSGIPSAGSILARRGEPGMVNLTSNLPTGVPEDERIDLFDEKRERNEIMGEYIDTAAALDEYEREREGDLTREDREAIAQMREQIAQGLEQIEAEERVLLSRQSDLRSQTERLQEELFGDEPILPGADPDTIQILNRALGRSTLDKDVSNRELMTIMDEIVNSNLSTAEKEGRLDFIMERAGAQDEIQTALRDELQTTINNVVVDREGLERMSNMTDLELLGNEAEFNTTMFDFELDADPMHQQLFGITTMLDEGYEELTGKELPPSIAPKLENGETGLIDDLMRNPDLVNTTGFQQRVSDVAAELGIKHSDLLGMIQEGMEYGNLRVDLWDNALNKNQFTPQSEEFAMAIFQVAQAIVGPDIANKMAESEDLHMIVAGQSGGLVGRDIGDGDKHGIGGLTDEAYERIGVDYEEIRGDTAEELAALVRYIVQEYGTPVEAINAYKRTGIWGD